MLLRQPNQGEDNIELVPSQLGAATRRQHDLEYLGLRVTWDITIGQQLLDTLNTDTIAFAVPSVEQCVESVNVRIGHVRGRKQRLDESFTWSFLGGWESPGRVVGVQVVCEQAVARLARRLGIVIEERRRLLRALRRVIVVTE
jgi:hypothetical protein